MIILGIDTSCDDTCISIIKVSNLKYQISKFEILSNVVSSQVRLHAKYGGVYPFLAKREHQKNLPIVLKRAIKEGGKPNIDLVAVTIGPGLEPCLWEGINFAKELAKKLKVPIIPVNHIEAHILVNFIHKNFRNIFPAICLIVSGGHTQLILMERVGKYKILGETRDDAAGECFDKVARILDLGYPGGPAIAAEAAKFSIFNSQFSIKLPRPMINQKNYDFSFSGLKTAVLYCWQNQPEKIRKSEKFIQEIAKETQEAIIDVLIEKTFRAIKEYKAKTIILGGGVAANEELRKKFKLKIKNLKLKINFFVPSKNLCTDNAAMVAVAGYFNWKKEKIRNFEKIKAEANLKLC